MQKRLIEHDLPLADISQESAREKSIRHGHPSTLHIWWARKRRHRVDVVRTTQRT
jgi:putative DNA methylase